MSTNFSEKMFKVVPPITFIAGSVVLLIASPPNSLQAVAAACYLSGSIIMLMYAIVEVIP